jgi:hypothetical protein
MAVNDRNEQNQSTTQQAAPQAQPQQPYASQAGVGAGVGQPHVGMGNINQVLRRSGTYDSSETHSAEALRGLKEAARQALEAQRLTDDFELIRFDRDANRVGLSAILVTKFVKSSGTVYAAVRTLLLDSEGVRLKPKVEQYGAQRIELPTRPQDVFNDVYWGRLTDFLRRQRGMNDLVVVDAGPLVVPTDFDFKDELATSRLLITSVNRCDDIKAKVQGEVPFNAAQVKRADERLTARIDLTGEPSYNVVGEPVRSDILINMNRTSAQASQEEDYYERETQFNSVAGFVNLEYTPAPVVQQVPGWGQQPQGPQPIFTPTFVITDVSQADWIQAQTPELYWLALSNAYRVTAGTQWVKAFLPQVGRKGVDPRDIGALGYLTQAGAKIETKSDSFTEQDFIELMGALVKPQPSFLIDVNPVGDHAAIENYLIDAAFEGPNQAKAIQKLIQAADNLTGGRFSAHFNARENALVVPYGQEIHLGHYIGEDGEKRDIRDLDVLAMLNLTQGNVGDFMEWYRTLCDTSIPHALRLQQRERFERQFLSKSLKITGRAVRLLFTPQCIEALDLATREAGVTVDFENMTSIMGGQRFTGNTMVGQYTVSRSANMGYGQPAGASYNPAAYGGVTGSGRLY